MDGGIVSGFRILEGNAGEKLSSDRTRDHLRLFGKGRIWWRDRNVHSKENELVAKR